MQNSRKILISGASGFIGTALSPFLEEQGFETWSLVRSESTPGREISWKPGTPLDPRDIPEGTEAVINLSGYPISVPFTEENKRKILGSRIKSTRTLVECICAMDQPPAAFISASGIGYYGDRGEELLTEDAGAGTDFVSEVCVQWEAELGPLKEAGVRSVALRTGIVLDPSGGAMAKMLPAFRLGAGAVLGSGQQYMSWISLADYLRAVHYAIDHDQLSGPLNLCSPNPVSNAAFSRSLASALHRPLLFSAPAWLLKAALGSMAELLLLASQRAIPAKLDKAGFTFEDGDIDAALSGMFGK